MANPPAGTCLLAGCGYAGTRLARRLAGRVPVLALVRTGASAAALAREGLPALAVDLDGGEPVPVPADLGAVICLAPPGGEGMADLRFRRLLAALGDARPGVLLYLSTTAVYGDTGGAPVDEAAAPAPEDLPARRRLDAEDQARRWCAERGVRCAVFRVAAIYGPHRLPLERLRRREPVLRPEDTGPGNRIHVDDLVAACAAVLEGGAEGIFNLADGCPWSPAEFAERVASLAGLPPPRRVGWPEAEASLSPGLLAYFRGRRRIVAHRLVRDLGVQPRDPETGIRESLREMGISSEGR